MQSSWIYPGHQFQTEPSALEMRDQHEKQQTHPGLTQGMVPAQGEAVGAVLSLHQLRAAAQEHWEPPQQTLSLCPLTDKRIYRLPVFTQQFCQALLDELENFEQSDMPKGRPNTMNNYGVGLIPCASLPPNLNQGEFLKNTHLLILLLCVSPHPSPP